MAVERIAAIDVEVTSIGQRDQSETWTGALKVEQLDDGRVLLGSATQSGFESIAFELDDLQRALAYLGDGA